MMSMTVQFLEFLVLTLTGLIGVRAVSLAKQESQERNTASAHSELDEEIILVDQRKESAEENRAEGYEKRLAALKEAQIFAGIQMISVKREFNNLLDPDMLWLREAIALYLVGACDIISKSAGCDLKTRKKFSALVLSTTLKLKEMELAKTIQLAASRTPGSDEDDMVIAGAKAATQWKATQDVKDSLKLRTRINDWGVFV